MGGGGSTDPKMVVRNNGFCGCRRPEILFWAYGRGKFFCLTQCVYTQTEFCGEFKNG